VYHSAAVMLAEKILAGDDGIREVIVMGELNQRFQRFQRLPLPPWSQMRKKGFFGKFRGTGRSFLVRCRRRLPGWTHSPRTTPGCPVAAAQTTG
jgi:hypothetical protein